MPCQIGSGPGAAAMAGWQLRQLVLLLVLFSVMPHGAFPHDLALPPTRPQRELTCNSVPYPFGVRGSSPPGFEVTCGRNNTAMLQIGGHSYKLEHVSMDGGFITILAGPIRQVCYNRNGKSTQITGTGDMSLEGTPFSLSKRNRLVVTGCNYRLVAKFGNSPNSNTNPWRPTACSSWCNGSTNAVDEDSCLEQIACCEALMPMDGAKEFTLTFDDISGHITGNEDNTCNAVFFLHQDDQVFMGGKDGKQRALKDALSPAGERRMILDWAFGPGTCDQALNYNLAPLCNNMSDCIDAPSGAGYICKCNPGYSGNAYAPGGCLGTAILVEAGLPTQPPASSPSIPSQPYSGLHFASTGLPRPATACRSDLPRFTILVEASRRFLVASDDALSGVQSVVP